MDYNLISVVLEILFLANTTSSLSDFSLPQLRELYNDGPDIISIIIVYKGTDI